MAKKQSRNPDPNTTRFSIQAFNTAHFRTTEAYAAMIDVLFDRATDAITKAAARGEYDPDKPFSFDDYPELKKKMQETLVQLTSRMTTVIETGTKQEWLFAVRKNDAFLASIMDTSKLTKAQLAQLQDRNLDGLKAFQERKGKMGLSKEVWKIGQQYQDQIQDALDVGLGDGRSAQALARDVKQNLKHPDKLFRRVRDKHGNLRLSKAAAEYHPGQGVYRSAVKNAQRLTRTEINMAYRESDYQRWQQLDFVVGFEVFRSNHDPLCKCKVCEKLVGRYPKNFKFIGWHPQCMCYAVPILMDEETFDENELGDLKAALRGTEYKKKQAKNLVTTMPDGFNEWVASHTDRQAGWKSTPYFIRDNFKNGSLADGLKDSIFDGTPTTKKTDPAQDELNMMAAEINKAIQDANYWGLGHLSGKLQNAVNAKDVAGVKATIAEIKTECARVEAIRNKWLADANALIAECKSLGVDSSALEQAKVDILPEHWGTPKTQQMAQQMLDDVRKAIDAFKAAAGSIHPAMKTDYKTTADVDETFKEINKDFTTERWFEHGDLKLDDRPGSGCNGSTYMDGRISLTPARLAHVQSALGKIGRGQGSTITFEEADAMATFWHEITHNRNIPGNTWGNTDTTKMQTRYMELANEFVARHSLSEFYAKLGVKSVPHPEFQTNRASTGYNYMVTNYDYVIDVLGLDRAKVYATVRSHLFTAPYNNQVEGLKKGLLDGGLHLLATDKKGNFKPIGKKDLNDLVKLIKDARDTRPWDWANSCYLPEKKKEEIILDWLKQHGIVADTTK